MAILLTTKDEAKPLTPANPKTGFTLAELYAAIGCSLIEIVYLPDGKMLVIDEEGKLNDKPLNLKATTLALHVVSEDDYIVGDALLCSTEEVK